MIIPHRKAFLGMKRSFGGSLPRSQDIADMFTYLEENYNPSNILEFGFNAGHSATWFLRTFNSAKIISFDPKEATIDNKKIHMLFEKKYKPRFKFYASFSAAARTKCEDIKIDMVFIDGGHTFGAVYDDIETALMLKIPVILIDNMELEPQQKAVSKFESNLQLIKSFPYYTINNDYLKHERFVNLYHVLNYDIQEP